MGSFNWAIPATLAPGTDYMFKVTSTSLEHVNDVSDANVAIVRIPPAISLITPNGGEIWVTGSTQTIRWSYSGNPGSSVKINLLKNGVFLRTIVASTPIGTSGNGSFTWSIPGSLVAGADYQVRVIASNTLYKDTSDALLTITRSSP